jgi:hypothetical protein
MWSPLRIRQALSFVALVVFEMEPTHEWLRVANFPGSRLILRRLRLLVVVTSQRTSETLKDSDPDTLSYMEKLE